VVLAGCLVADEALLDLSFGAAAARLAEAARGGLLTRMSQGAYGDGVRGLARVGPLGAAPVMSKLVEVHFLDLAVRGGSAVLALRWQAAGPGGRFFPALDADIALTPAGDHATRLSLAGAYRPPLGLVVVGLDKATFPHGGRDDDTVPASPHRGHSHPPNGPRSAAGRKPA
jgi:hypothetical protein